VTRRHTASRVRYHILSRVTLKRRSVSQPGALTMKRDDLVRETYAHFGLAMYNAQVLEHGIVNAMVVARMPERDKITRSGIDAFMNRQFDSTLGQLVRELQRYVEVPNDLEESLRKALSRRNWLAHDYFRERAEDFVTDAGCHRMIEELGVAQRLFQGVDEKLTGLVRPIREKFGLTDEAIVAESQALMAKARVLDG